MNTRNAMGLWPSPACESFDRSNIRQISDHVFQLGKKPEKPSAEIVFFHGLQLEDQKEPHLTTWLSRDKTQIWLNWLITEFRDVRILLVRYDASTKKTTDSGRMDRFITGENLLGDLTRGGDGGAKVGEAGCPVILVGHCLGGLILKEVCVQAGNRTGPKEYADFLRNVRAVLFYASPHHGSELPGVRHPQGALLVNVSLLYEERARRNEEFRKLQEQYKWESAGFGELRPVDLNNFRGLVVQEASSRSGVNTYYTVDADHFNVCRPESQQSTNYIRIVDLMKEVIRKDKASVPFPNDLAGNIVGLEEAVETITSKLVAESRIAIVGMGGIGKTTLAQAVFQRVGKDFEYSCFYEEVKKSVGETESPDSLRDKLRTKFVDKRGRRVDNAFQWNELSGKRVLVVLDDVTSESQIRVMMRDDAFHSGSRVIITARNRRFIDGARLGFHMHEVDKLNTDTARELFCLFAFNKKESPPDFRKETEAIVEKCDGHPLALTITAKYLSCTQGKSEWEEALDSLRKAQSLNGDDKDGLWSLLRPSYMSLALAEREMFLDVAAFLHGEWLDEAKMVWKVCKWAAPDRGWRNLLDRHLVKEQKEEGYRYPRVYMHEVLRDLGREIAGKSRMLVHDLHLVDKFSNQDASDVKVVKGEMIALDHNSEALLCKLTNIRVLWLDKHGPYKDTSNHGQQMESNWSALKKVLFAKLSGANSSTLTMIRGSKNLRILDICGSDNLEAIPAEIGGLEKLEDLDMSWCIELVAIPAEIGGLQNLQKLNLTWCPSLKAIPAGIRGLQRLRNLSLSHCLSLQAIPAEIGGLQNLHKLNLSDCPSLKEIPAEIRGLRSLLKLNLSGCTKLVAIPAEIGELQSLQNLDLSDCSSLEAIPAEIGGLQSLQKLNLSQCEKLVVIPAEICRLQSLQDLKLSYCSSLRAIPAASGGLQSLEKLNLSHYSSLEAILVEIGGLQRLQNLNLSGCKKLVIPTEVGQLQNVTIYRRVGEDWNVIPTPSGYFSRNYTNHTSDHAGDDASDF